MNGRGRLDPDQTEREIAGDVRKIMQGEDVRQGDSAGAGTGRRPEQGSRGQSRSPQAGKRESGERPLQEGYAQRAGSGRTAQGARVHGSGSNRAVQGAGAGRAVRENHAQSRNAQNGAANRSAQSRNAQRRAAGRAPQNGTAGDPRQSAGRMSGSAGGRRPGRGRGRRRETPEERAARIAYEKDLKARRRRLSRPYQIISWAFIAIFILLMGNLVYFNVYEKDSILSSPYNKRQDALAKFVLRGPIKSSDGQTLAYTQENADGTDTRVYPYSNEYAHVVGYTVNGKGGLESVCNYDLLTAHNNLWDQIVNGFEDKRNPGDTVVTTLDTRLQDAAWNALGDYNGAVVAMEPKTGRILCMVSKPSFDPNTLASTWDSIVSDSSSSVLLNRATQGLYAPGSTFKIVTSLAYLRAHGTISDFSWDCTGSIDVDGNTIHCAGGEVHGTVDFTHAFAESCNTAFSEIGLETGVAGLTDAAESFLIGKSLPCDISASKSRWNLRSSDSNYILAMTAFGQAQTSVTPYQMLLITSAIANDGTLMTPYLIDHVETDGGTVISSTDNKSYGRLITSDEASVLKGLMEAVVSEGTGTALAGQSYSAAGKTGTAQYTMSDGSIGTHAWFVGFSNVDDPDLAVAAIAENGGSGASAALPIVKAVMDTYYANGLNAG